MIAIFALLRPFLPYIIGIAVALGGAFWFGEHERGIGEAKIQKLWDADKAKRMQAVTDQVNRWNEQRLKTEEVERERDNLRNAQFAQLQTRAASLPVSVAATRVPAAVVGVLNSASDTANAAGTAAESHEAAAPAASSADSTLGLIASWYVEVAQIHRECVDRVSEWEQFYDSLRKTQ